MLRPLDFASVLVPGEVQEALGAFVLAEPRGAAMEPSVVLGPDERLLLGRMRGPYRRTEWLAGRRVAKQLLAAAFAVDARRVQILPQTSGAPAVWVDGVACKAVRLNISHTRSWAVAAAAPTAVGIDVCDDVDGPRLKRVGRRVFSFNEAESCRAHHSPQTQAAVWAIKEACLKLRMGGVFAPGARSVCVLSHSPPRVADATVQLTLLRLPSAVVALARFVLDTIAKEY